MDKEYIKQWDIKTNGVPEKIKLRKNETLLDYIFSKFFKIISWHEDKNKIIVKNDKNKYIIELCGFCYL